MALGEVDYGLMGLVGGMTGSVSFLNSILAGSVGRFYAVSVGAARKAGNEVEGLEDCRRWFNTALSIHTVVPLVLVAIGYPIGIWAVEHFLTIPPEKVMACVWVWRFVCVSCFIGMVNVPFNAMYTAKQEIAELTIYGFFTTTANALFLYYMVSHPGIWLTKYAAWTCCIAIAPQLIIIARAMIVYPECKIVRAYWYNIDRFKQLFKFVVARFWSDFSSTFSDQGQSILVNKYMGPVYNAAKAIGTTVASQALTLSGAISSAFSPAIANLCGEGKMEEMKRFCFMSCRISSVMVLVFAIPVMIEIRELLRLWLVNPPDFSAEICVIILLRGVFENMTGAYATAIYSKGYKVVKYAWTVGWAGICTVFVSWLFFALGFGMWSLVIGLAVSKTITVGVRLAYGKEIVGFETSYWFKHVCGPIVLVATITGALSYAGTCLMAPSFLRVVMTTAISECVFLPMVWHFVLADSERTYVVERLQKLLPMRK